MAHCEQFAYKFDVKNEEANATQAIFSAPAMLANKALNGISPSTETYVSRLTGERHSDSKALFSLAGQIITKNPGEPGFNDQLQEFNNIADVVLKFREGAYRGSLTPSNSIYHDTFETVKVTKELVNLGAKDSNSWETAKREFLNPEGSSKYAAQISAGQTIREMPAVLERRIFTAEQELDRIKESARGYTEKYESSKADFKENPSVSAAYKVAEAFRNNFWIQNNLENKQEQFDTFKSMDMKAAVEIAKHFTDPAKNFDEIADRNEKLFERKFELAKKLEDAVSNREEMSFFNILSPEYQNTQLILGKEIMGLRKELTTVENQIKSIALQQVDTKGLEFTFNRMRDYVVTQDQERAVQLEARKIAEQQAQAEQAARKETQEAARKEASMVLQRAREQIDINTAPKRSYILEKAMQPDGPKVGNNNVSPTN